MALIEYDVYKQKLRDLEPELKKLGDALDIDAVAQEAARLEDETTQDGFWNNLERSQKVQTRLKQLQNKLHRFKKAHEHLGGPDHPVRDGPGGGGRRDPGRIENRVPRRWKPRSKRSV